MLRGAVELCLQARWGVSEQAAPAARLHGEELARTLDRLVDHYARSFLFKDPDRFFSAPLEKDDARRRLVRLVDAAGEAGARDRPDDRAEVRAFATFVGRMETFLRDFAAHQLRTQYPLLRDDSCGASPAAAAPTSSASTG